MIEIHEAKEADAAGLLAIYAPYVEHTAITFEYDGGTANAKSVLSVLGACIKCGDEIELICDGADEQEAMKALTDAISGGLGE